MSNKKNRIVHYRLGPIQKKPLYSALLHYEAKVSLMLRKWANLSDEQKRFQPGNGSFGLDGIYAQMIDLERLTLFNMIQRAQGRFKQANNFQKTKPSFLSLNLLLPYNRKSSVYKLQYASNIDASAIQSVWLRQIKVLHQFVMALSIKQQHLPLFKHPNTDVFDACKTLKFLRCSLIHKLVQINRIIQHRNFPQHTLNEFYKF
jgi:hypothetical protein